jgi:hypothetical protein
MGDSFDGAGLWQCAEIGANCALQEKGAKTDRAEDAQIAYASRPRSVQLEVLATDQRAAFARSLLAPWLKKAGE